MIQWHPYVQFIYHVSPTNYSPCMLLLVSIVIRSRFEERICESRGLPPEERRRVSERTRRATGPVDRVVSLKRGVEDDGLGQRHFWVQRVPRLYRLSVDVQSSRIILL